MDYGEILSKAWKIIWKYKVLWIFGLFASCSSNNGNSSNFRTSSSNGRAYGGLPPQIERMLEWMITPTGIAVIISVMLVFTIIGLAIASIGIIGLQKGTRLGDQGVEKMTFSELWAESTPYYWRIFWLNMFLFLIGILSVLILMAGPLYYLFVNRNSFGQVGELDVVLPMIMMLFACMCCIFLPFSWVLGMLTNMWTSAIILDDCSWGEGFARAWKIFKDNFWNLVGLSVILFLISLAAGFVIAIPLFAVMMPVVIAVQTARTDTSALLIPLLCMVALSPVLWFLRAVLTSYVQSVWTLAYLRLTAPVAGQDVPMPVEVVEA
jgi:hypothetical protein